jgi:hypothetical protein
MFPYHDENETQRVPLVTLALIAANVEAWVLVPEAGAPRAPRRSATSASSPAS